MPTSEEPKKMSHIQKPSPIQPFELSNLVNKLESTAVSNQDGSNTQSDSGDTASPRTPPQQKRSLADVMTKQGGSNLSVTENMFDNMSLVSPAFTPVPDSYSPQDIPTQAPSPAIEDGHSTPKAHLPELPNVYCESRARIPTTNGAEIFLHLYKNDQDNKEHLAIVFGQHIHSKTLFAPRPNETENDRMTRGAYVGKLYPGRQRSDDIDQDKNAQAATSAGSSTESHNLDTLVRIHSECYTGETAWSARCDCGEQLDEAARLMALEGSGVIVYLRQEGRGIGLGEKLKAYNLQDLGADTVTANLMLRHPADGRSFGLATAILKDLGLDRVRLLTNNPDKIKAVEGKHKEVRVTQRVPMVPLSWQNKGGFRSKEVEQYLKTKVERMGHMLPLSEL